ncbi:MAG: hypothetical protein M1549_03290 [Candidatus Dependentiae bacterium]|nr:hypothetical protein [Candidatus Dependentiae bacterium]
MLGAFWPTRNRGGGYIIYGGEKKQQRRIGTVLGRKDAAKLVAKIEKTR